MSLSRICCTCSRLHLTPVQSIRDVRSYGEFRRTSGLSTDIGNLALGASLTTRKDSGILHGETADVVLMTNFGSGEGPRIKKTKWEECW